MSERPPILMVRHGRNLVPMSEFDLTALERFPVNKGLKVRVSRDRSSRQLRLYWGVLAKVAENLDQDVTDDDLHEWLKLKLDLTTPVKQRNGEIAWVPRSVALDKMKQPEFNAYFDRVKDLIVEHLIPGLRINSLMREVREMLGDESEADSAPPRQLGAVG